MNSTSHFPFHSAKSSGSACKSFTYGNSCSVYFADTCSRHVTDTITPFTSLFYLHFNGLVQDCINSSALAMELLWSCTKPSIWYIIVIDLLGASISWGCDIIYLYILTALLRGHICWKIALKICMLFYFLFIAKLCHDLIASFTMQNYIKPHQRFSIISHFPNDSLIH